MVSFLPPDLNTTFVIAVLVPLVLGFIVGVVIRSMLKIGIALVAIVIILIAIGIVSPSQVIQPLIGLVRSGPALTSAVNRLAGYLPYSSLTFVIGLAVGLLRG